MTGTRPIKSRRVEPVELGGTTRRLFLIDTRQGEDADGVRGFGALVGIVPPLENAGVTVELADDTLATYTPGKSVTLREAEIGVHTGSDEYGLPKFENATVIYVGDTNTEQKLERFETIAFGVGEYVVKNEGRGAPLNPDDHIVGDPIGSPWPEQVPLAEISASTA